MELKMIEVLINGRAVIAQSVEHIGQCIALGGSKTQVNNLKIGGENVAIVFTADHAEEKPQSEVELFAEVYEYFDSHRDKIDFLKMVARHLSPELVVDLLDFIEGDE